ncbi:dTMP kinase [Acidicapsa ligni]|uniref:dTMP kinase n=1 Tax=Acidicapsa ligni TaxID=542300 RepID=UPI0021DF980A|nr:dTMP kinase [Acidicapsa ligni]
MQPQSQRGFFITFEGLDGSGKTTQIKRLTAWLAARNIAPVVTRQPGGTETGDRIRALLLDSKSTGLSPKTELAMMFADRAQAIEEIIAPALRTGKIVVCDRFTDSTEAYQGCGRELGSQIVLELHRLICNDLRPDLTILLLPDLAASLARARRRNTHQTSVTGKDESRFEQEQNSFFHRVYTGYKAIAAREPDRVLVIEGDLTVEEVHAQVTRAVSSMLRQMNLISS